MTIKVPVNFTSIEDQNQFQNGLVPFHHQWTVNHFEVFCHTDDLVNGYPIISSEIMRINGRKLSLWFYPKGEEADNGHLITLYVDCPFPCYYQSVLSTENYTVAASSYLKQKLQFNRLPFVRSTFSFQSTLTVTVKGVVFLENACLYKNVTFEKMMNNPVLEDIPLSSDKFNLQAPTSKTYSTFNWTIGEFRKSLNNVRLEKIIEKLPDKKTKIIMFLEKSKVYQDSFSFSIKCVSSSQKRKINFWLRITGFDQSGRVHFLKNCWLLFIEEEKQENIRLRTNKESFSNLQLDETITIKIEIVRFKDEMLQQSQKLKYYHLISVLHVYKKLNLAKWNIITRVEKNTKMIKNVKTKKYFTLANNKLSNVILNVNSKNTIHGDFCTSSNNKKL